MNRHHNIDDFFAPLRETTDVAPMHLWAEIEAQIAPPKEKRRFFLWFGLIGLLLLGIGSLAVLANSNSKQQSQPEKTSNLLHSPINLKHKAKNTKKSPQKANLTPLENKNKTAKPKPIATNNSFVKKQQTNLTNQQTLIVNPPTQPSVGLDYPTTPNRTNSDLANSQKQPLVKLGLTAKINSLIIPLPQNKLKLPKNIFAQAAPDGECAGSRVIKVPKSIFADAYVSPVFSNTFYAARTAEASSYGRLRDSTEHNAMGIMAGARVGYIHETGLNFRAGFAWQQIRNKFVFLVEQDEKMIVQIHRDNLGNIIGRDTTFEYGRRRLDITNKYTSIDLPLSIGYISMKNKVQLGLHVGTVLNLNFKQSGTYLNEQHQITTFADRKIFNKNISTSFFGSIELQYLIGEQWGVFMEPQARFYPKSFTSSSYPLKQNITTFNVLTGLKYIF